MDKLPDKPTFEGTVLWVPQAETIGTLLAGLGLKFRVPAGETLFHEGDPADKVYFVERGTVVLYVLAASGEEKTIAVCPAGSTVGESSLCHGYVNVCSARTLEDSLLIGVSRTLVLEEFLRNVELRTELYASLVRKLEMVTLQVVLLSLHRPFQRIVRILLERPGNEIHLSHETLGAMAGCSRVTVTRHLDRLCREGVIELGRERILIHDRAALAAQLRGSAPGNTNGAPATRQAAPFFLRTAVSASRTAAPCGPSSGRTSGAP